MVIEKRYDSEYNKWLRDLKARIKRTQIKAALSANSEIIMLYWEIGKELYENKRIKDGGILLLTILKEIYQQNFLIQKVFRDGTYFI